MFFKKASDGTASNEVRAFHDWQIVCKGNAMIDIARIMYGFADPEVRREAEKTIVEDYYEHLKEGMSREGRVLDVTIEQLREAYALAAIHQAAEMGLLFPGFIESMNKDDFAPNVLDAWREKTLLRAKLTLRDTIENLRKYAPQFLAE